MAIIDELDIGIIAALVGVTASLAFSWAKEKREKTKEINKIQILLNDDFSKLYKEITKDLQFFQNELDKLDTDDDLPSKLIVGSVDVPEVYSTYGIFYEFEYWQAIVSSGSLLKLEKDEIRHVQAAYNSIEWYNKELVEAHKETMDELIECLNPDDSDPQIIEEPDKEEIRDILKGYFMDVISMMNECVDDLRELQKFSWFTV